MASPPPPPPPARAGTMQLQPAAPPPAPAPAPAPAAYTLKNPLGITMTDENVREIVKLMYEHCVDGVEIEAKLGFLTTSDNPATGGGQYTMAIGAPQRLRIPGLTTLVAIDRDLLQRRTEFTANVGASMFHHLNTQVLNGRVEVDKWQRKQYGAPRTMRFKSQNHIDYLYGDVRVSRDQQSNEIVAIVKKHKARHLTFHNPHPTSCDFRISAAVEEPVAEHDVDWLRRVALCRKKDRVSYIFELWQIDISAVMTYSEEQLQRVDSSGRLYKIVDERQGTKTYEVEVECVDNKFVQHHAQLAREGKPNQMTMIAAALYDTVRAISKFAFPSVPLPATCVLPEEVQQQKKKAKQQDAAVGSKRNADPGDQPDDSKRAHTGDGS